MPPPPINPVRIIIPTASPEQFRVAIDIVGGFKCLAEKLGGAGGVFRRTDSVVGEIEGLSSQLLDKLITSWRQTAIKHGRDLGFSVHPRTENLPEKKLPGEILLELLTQKLLFELPIGAWIVSNLGHRWTAHLESPDTDRRRVWENAVAAKVAHRYAYVVWSRSDVEAICRGIKPQDNPYNLLASAPKQFTFWSRKDAAGRFAGAPLLEAINMISARARTLPAPAGRPLVTKTILIGHSFGAYVIEKTVLQSISTSPPTMAADQTSYITPPADLVILLNSAAPAIYAKEFIEFLKWHGVGRDQPPFVISVSSEGDWATKDLFPAGTIPATAFDVGSYQGKDTYHGANEKTFFTHTPGHTEYLPSFDAYPTGKVPSDQFESDYQYEWIFYRNLFPTDFTKTDLSFLAWGGELAKTSAAAPAQIWQLKPTRSVDSTQVPFNDTPYWLVRVPTSIIADHGDVWCPNSMNLLTSLIRLSGIADSGSKLRTIKLSPEKAPDHDQLAPLLKYGKDN